MSDIEGWRSVQRTFRSSAYLIIDCLYISAILSSGILLNKASLWLPSHSWMIAGKSPLGFPQLWRSRELCISARARATVFLDSVNATGSSIADV